MTSQRDWMPAITELTERMFDGDISAAEQKELNEILSQGAEQRRCYLACANLLSALERKYSAVPTACPTLDNIAHEQDAAPRLPTPFSFHNAWHGTIGFFSQEIPFALLVASLIMGLGLLAGSLIYVSHHRQIAESKSRPSAPSSNTAKPRTGRVGRITDMAGCKRSGRWTMSDGRIADIDLTQILNSSSFVSLGDKLTLSSGVLEITYDCGAKVILQGPVTYEVDSHDGGFLSIGKLTARLEKRQSAVSSPQSEKMASGQPSVVSGQWPVASNEGTGGRGQGSEAANQKSKIKDHKSLAPAFAVRTPTATVTDLGTEFGVEVDDKNVCHVETFVGLVEVKPTSSLTAEKGQSLAAGDAISVDSSGVITKKKRSSALHFVRAMPPPEPAPYMKAVLEDRPLAYWPLNESPTVSWITDRSGHGCDGHFVGNVRLVRGGPFGDNHRRSAEFSGNGYIQVPQLPKSDPAKGFAIELWAKADAGRGHDDYRSPLSYRDDRGVPNRTGFMFYVTTEDAWRFQVGTGDFWDGVDGPAVAPGQWVYLAGTFQPTSKETNGMFQGLLKFYVNGKAVATTRCPWKPNDMMPLRIGAGMSELPEAGYFFIGNIADVAVYGQPLEPDRIRVHWEKGRASDANANRSEKKEALPKAANP